MSPDAIETQLAVYVPAPGWRHTIHPKSGIVGSPASVRDQAWDLCIDFHGDLYPMANIVTYADRVHHAADRHLVRYPTVARAWVRFSDVIHVGTWFHVSQELVIFDADRDLQRWLDCSPIPPAELRISPRALRQDELRALLRRQTQGRP